MFGMVRLIPAKKTISMRARIFSLYTSRLTCIETGDNITAQLRGRDRYHTGWPMAEFSNAMIDNLEDYGASELLTTNGIVFR